MPSFLSKFNFRTHPATATSILLPLYFLILYTLLDYGYRALSDETLRLYYHDFFIAFCAFIIDIIAPEDTVKVIQNSIISAKANLAIVRTCDGSTSFFLLTSAILVFRSTLKLTLLGIFLALILVLFLNTIRIVSLFFLMDLNHSWFSYVHITVAPFLLLSLSSAYFAFWAYFANEVKQGGA